MGVFPAFLFGPVDDDDDGGGTRKRIRGKGVQGMGGSDESPASGATITAAPTVAPSPPITGEPVASAPASPAAKVVTEGERVTTSPGSTPEDEGEIDLDSLLERIPEERWRTHPKVRKHVDQIVRSTRQADIERRAQEIADEKFHQQVRAFQAEQRQGEEKRLRQQMELLPDDEAGRLAREYMQQRDQEAERIRAEAAAEQYRQQERHQIARYLYETARDQALADLTEDERKAIALQTPDGGPRTLKEIIAESREAVVKREVPKRVEKEMRSLKDSLKQELLGELRGQQEAQSPEASRPGAAANRGYGNYAEAREAYRRGDISAGEFNQARRELFETG